MHTFLVNFGQNLKCTYGSVMFLLDDSFFLWTDHCVKSVGIRGFSGPYCPVFGLNKGQKNSKYGHFSRSGCFLRHYKTFWKCTIVHVFVKIFNNFFWKPTGICLHGFCRYVISLMKKVVGMRNFKNNFKTNKQSFIIYHLSIFFNLHECSFNGWQYHLNNRWKYVIPVESTTLAFISI